MLQLMNDQEKKLLEETKNSVLSPPKESKNSDISKSKDIDVEALLRFNGLSQDLQPKESNRKWIALTIVAGVLFISMIIISILLSNLSK